MAKKVPGRKKVAALILDRLGQIEDRLESLGDRIGALEQRIDSLASEKVRRDHRDARMEERRISYERRFDMYED